MGPMELDELKSRFGFMDTIKDVSFETPENQEEPLMKRSRYLARSAMSAVTKTTICHPRFGIA